jgi:hypothetical protein
MMISFSNTMSSLFKMALERVDLFHYWFKIKEPLRSYLQ